MVGERGVTLSGGQQQRVAIARTLLQNACILVFDDSMSAVDAETDAAIRNSLTSLHKSGIMFLISHRIPTLCRADLILVLEDGEIVQRGTHESLMALDGLYRRIADIQDMQMLSDAETPSVVQANAANLPDPSGQQKEVSPHERS